MAFVWSQRELILAFSAMVIHHQLNNTVRGGEHDKKRGKREESERERGRERYCIVSVKTKESHMFAKICCNPINKTIQNTTVTNTIIIPKDVFGSSKS